MSSSETIQFTIQESWINAGNVAPSSLQAMSDEGLNALLKTIWDRFDELKQTNRLIDEVQGCRTFIQKVFGASIVDQSTFPNPERHHENLFKLQRLVTDEMSDRGMIEMVKVGIDFGAKDVTFRSKNDYGHRSFDPVKDTPDVILNEAATYV